MLIGSLSFYYSMLGSFKRDSAGYVSKEEMSFATSGPAYLEEKNICCSRYEAGIFKYYGRYLHLHPPCIGLFYYMTWWFFN